MRKPTVWVYFLSALGGLIAFAAQVSFEDAKSNISTWVARLGWDRLTKALGGQNVDTIAFWFGLILVAIAVVLWIKVSRASETDQARKHKEAQKHSATRGVIDTQKETPPPIEHKTNTGRHDIWLSDAISYIVTRDWDAPCLTINDGALDEIFSALAAIRQYASDEDITIYGKYNFSGPHIPIDARYWRNYGFNALRMLADKKEDWKTEHKTGPQDQSIFHSLKTSKARIEELFPGPQQDFQAGFSRVTNRDR